METQTQETELIELEVMTREAQALVPVDKDKAEMVEALKSVKGRFEGYGTYAASLKIVTKDDAENAGAFLDGIAEDIATVESATKSWKDKAFQFHRKITGLCNLFTGPLETHRKAIKGKVIAWTTEQERIAEKQRALAQAELDKKAEAERQRLLRKAAAAKRPETAERKREEAAAIVAPVVHIEAPKPVGVKMQKRWNAQVEDVALFLHAAINDPNLTGYIAIDTTKLARGKSANTSMLIAGIKFYQTTV